MDRSSTTPDANRGGLDRDDIDRSWDVFRGETEQNNNHVNAVTQFKTGIACECINTRIGETPTAGGMKPVFIVELDSEEINAPIIKYFNCDSKTKGRYIVPHNSDFAKLYRLTLGQNPTKRFSEAHKLLSHFREYRFIATLKQETLKNGQHYLKVTDIKPETPCKNDAWTTNGTLKKSSKKRENPQNWRTSSGKTADKQRKSSGQVADNKTLQGAISLEVEPVLNPTKTLNTKPLPTNTGEVALLLNDSVSVIDTFEDSEIF